MWCSVVLLSLQFKSRSPGKRVVRGIGGRVDTRMFGFREGRIDKINGCSLFIQGRNAVLRQKETKFGQLAKLMSRL